MFKVLSSLLTRQQPQQLATIFEQQAAKNKSPPIMNNSNGQIEVPLAKNLVWAIICNCHVISVAVVDFYSCVHAQQGLCICFG